MAEKDYIEREAAIAAAFSVTSLGDSAFRDVYDTVNRLRLIPAVDAVEVVRCGECKHSYEEIGGRTCTYGVCVDCLVAEDFFCADGKRKGGDE